MKVLALVIASTFIFFVYFYYSTSLTSMISQYS